ncbi:unnamed protein product [Clonostachys solani]|uniref:Uncharacterized protein n=1 Tax=Clonostachys solani TaxID=160281 RepID=A0A9N9ZNG1_9HYPO|nr:unnamed protein product [Clonostachys solani]
MIHVFKEQEHPPPAGTGYEEGFKREAATEARHTPPAKPDPKARVAVRRSHTPQSNKNPDLREFAIYSHLMAALDLKLVVATPYSSARKQKVDRAPPCTNSVVGPVVFLKVDMHLHWLHWQDYESPDAPPYTRQSSHDLLEFDEEEPEVEFVSERPLPVVKTPSKPSAKAKGKGKASL